MDDSHLNVTSITQVIDDRFNVLSSGAHHYEYGIRLFTVVFGDKSVMPSGQPAVFFIGLFQERQDVFGKIVAPSRYAVHVVFLILHRTQHHGMLQVDHSRHTPACGAKQDTLGFGRTFDNVIGAAQVFADQFRFRFQEGALQVGREEAILRVDAGIKA